MKEMRNWMCATILTLCGTLCLTMTSCSNDDNASNPVENAEQSKYTADQIQTMVLGGWLDEMQLTFSDNVRLYDISDKGQCDIYDFTFDDDDENVENIVTYNGTWGVTNDLSKLHFVDQLNIKDYELVGGLMVDAKKKVDESDETYKILAENGCIFDAVLKDTMAILRDKSTGGLTFINRTDASLIALILETGQFSNESVAKAAQRAQSITRAASDLPIEERIKNMVDVNNLFKVLNKSIDNHDYMGKYYFSLNPRICDMSILGAGGVPSTYLTKDQGKSMLTNYKRQYLSIKELWNLGVRYFDLGTIYVAEKGGGYGFYDEDLKNSIPNVTPRQVFQELQSLLKKYPSETAIIMLDQASGADSKTMQYVSGWVYNELKEVFGLDKLVLNYGPDLRLNDCCGKLIVMNNYSAPLADNPMGACMHNVWSNDIKTGDVEFPNGKKGKVTVQGNTMVLLFSAVDKREKVEKALQISDESAKSSEPHWVINHVAGRFGVPNYVLNYIVNASVQNEEVGKFLLKKKYAKTGIMVVDYVGIAQSDNFAITNTPFGVNLIAPIIGANFYASKNHLISLDEGDVVK